MMENENTGIAATIWTGINRRAKRKCIWKGIIKTLPPIGYSITARDGFGQETIKSASYNPIDNSAEIFIVNPDERDEYGECTWEK
jgi:hypothetical protein